MKLLFITDRSDRHQQTARRAAPPQLDFVPLRNPDRAQVLSEIGDTDFLFSERQGTIDAEIIAAGSRLRLIQRLGTRTYDIDLAAARRRDIPVCVMPIPYVIATAEHTLWQMLALVRRTAESLATAHAAEDWGPARRTDENTFTVNWSVRSGLLSLWQETVGILGFGEIGWELAHRLQNFGCRLLYYKRRRLPEHVELEQKLTYAELPQLLAHSRILVNLLPFSPETEHILNAETFAQMPAGAFFVSTGSGGTVDETALAQALEEGHLAGAAIDSFAWEPLPADNPLLPLARNPQQNVLLTPHTAAVSQHRDRSRDFENVRRILEGRPLVGVIGEQ